MRGHSHIPDAAALEVERLRLDMRKQIAASGVRPVEVVAAALREASDEVKMSFGRISTIKRDLRFTRQKQFPLAPELTW